MVETEREGGILVIRMSRPEKLNALNSGMVDELRLCIQLAADENVSVVVLAGRGTSFCAGADMEFLGLDRVAAREYLSGIVGLLSGLRQLTKPIVAGVQGFAVGAGAELACEADLIVLADNAVLRFPDVSIGSTPATLYRLTRLVGRATAARMVLLGEDLDAVTAKTLGVAFRVVPSASLLSEVMMAARRLAGLSVQSLRLAKQALNLAESADPITDLQVNLEAMVSCYESEAQREAVKAFMSAHRPK